MQCTARAITIMLNCMQGSGMLSELSQHDNDHHSTSLRSMGSSMRDTGYSFQICA